MEPRWPTFGIKLSAAPGTVSEVHDTVSMSWAMLNTMTGFLRPDAHRRGGRRRTIVIDTGTVRAADFGLDREAQDLLFRKGREAPLEFLDGTPGQPG